MSAVSPRARGDLGRAQSQQDSSSCPPFSLAFVRLCPISILHHLSLHPAAHPQLLCVLAAPQIPSHILLFSFCYPNGLFLLLTLVLFIYFLTLLDVRIQIYSSRGRNGPSGRGTSMGLGTSTQTGEFGTKSRHLEVIWNQI